MASQQFNWQPKRSYILWLALLVVAVYAVLPQFGSFRNSLSLVRHATLGWLLIGVACVAMTYVLAAITYSVLACRPLRYGQTLLVQVGGMFADRLLPAGIGGIGANYAYLRRSKHSPTQAVSVVTANNLLGFMGHLLVTVIIVSFGYQKLRGLHWAWHIPARRWQFVALAFVAAVLLIVALRFGPQVKRGLMGVLRELAGYRQRPVSLFAGLTSSISLTLMNVLSLYCCARALGAPVSLVTVLLIFGVGIAVGTATPTPGGIGGIEAGLVAGFVAVSLSPAEALAFVLLYRIISYWLALIAGIPAFFVALHRGYFSFHKDVPAS